jgi:hypothetical protein
MIVFVPFSTGTAGIIQWVVPDATPEAPVEDCQVTLVIPDPPVAVPARLRLVALVLVVVAEGVVMETATGDVPAEL